MARSDRHLYLLVREGPLAGTSAQVPQSRAIVGRNSQSAVHLDLESVSWEHAVIERKGSKWMFRNRSAGGSWINGLRIAGETPLSHGDRIMLSQDCTIEARIVDGSGKPVGNAISPWWIAAAAVVVVLAGLAVVRSGDSGTAPRSPSDAAVAMARAGFAQVIFDLEADNCVPRGAGLVFDEALRLEQTGLIAAAAHRWNELWGLLRSAAPSCALLASGDAPLTARVSQRSYDRLNTLLRSGGDTDALSSEERIDALLAFVHHHMRQTSNRGDS